LISRWKLSWKWKIFDLKFKVQFITFFDDFSALTQKINFLQVFCVNSSHLLNFSSSSNYLQHPRTHYRIPINHYVNNDVPTVYRKRGNLLKYLEMLINEDKLVENDRETFTISVKRGKMRIKEEENSWKTRLRVNFSAFLLISRRIFDNLDCEINLEFLVILHLNFWSF